MNALHFLLVFCGGGAGAVSRYLVATFVQQLANGWIFPIGTMVVNLTGCLVIGLLAGLAEGRQLFNTEWRLLLFVGFLGGYTTFSTFGYETFQLLRDAQFTYALAYSLIQLILGTILVWLGFVLTRAL